MEFKTEEFLIDRDVLTAKRISNRFDNLLDDLERYGDSCFDCTRKREEHFLLNEADKILEDKRASRAEKAFAGIVYQIVGEWQPDPE
jgi:hypothetical protein